MKGHVRWNEANIGEIEANKPVRQKITEPKTPYHPTIDDESSPSPVRGGFDECIEIEDQDDSANSEGNAFNNALSSSRTGTKQSDGWTSSEDEVQETEDEEGLRTASVLTENSGQFFHTAPWDQEAGAHYDEFLKVKELQQNASILEDASDEDNGAEHTKREGENGSTSSTSPP
ncbi:Protein phosphatase inhibitor [Vigna angularis]|uniref:Protein phosphatase inhibitor n=1 Tax=Phaseolus angularis TaxID=3914 RepID=A0A8T0KTD6_PHAAN|nr:Protein phosphatase inhibitor [Vigna angularis]